jgi:hypothetical protein
MEKITYDDFRNTILHLMKSDKPKQWRDGQFVFNYMETVYGQVARISQFRDGIDCFYNDDNIDAFIKNCYEILRKTDENFA